VTPVAVDNFSRTPGTGRAYVDLSPRSRNTIRTTLFAGGLLVRIQLEEALEGQSTRHAARSPGWVQDWVQVAGF
jgi:hypothetical protein